MAVCLLPAAFGAGPDFTGKWVLNEQRSDLARFRGPAPPWIEVRHVGETIECRIPAQGAEGAVEWRHFTTGRESRHKIENEEHRCILKWEGDALLTNTLVLAPRRQHTVMDRWRLSRDGSTLVIRRQVVTSRGESEAILVYERQE